MNKFDIIVIGKGLVGTAAAKYLSSHGYNIGIIGPEEPKDYDSSLVFASHYDQARIQRLLGKDEAWTKLNIDSVKQYEFIREQTGIEFHNQIGCLYVNPIERDKYLVNADVLGERFAVNFKAYLKGSDIIKDFPDFHFPATAHGLFETSPSGFINPRLLLKAQLRIFEKHNGVILRETVNDVSYSEHTFIIKTYEGNIYNASKVLVTAGSFVNFFNLSKQKLNLKIKNEVVLLAKVGYEQAMALAGLPALLYEINNDELDGIYLIQPVKYPDGNYYIKMGCNLPEDIYFENIEQVQNWFRIGNSDRFIERMKNALTAILPDIVVEEFTTQRCIINRSIHGRPYIGQTTQHGLYVASGCNGYSAMCSDAIGNVTSYLIVNGVFPDGYNARDFEIIYKK